MTAPARSSAVAAAIYRACVRLCPAAFRHEFGQQMVDGFNQAYAGAAAIGVGAAMRLLVLAVVDALRTAVRERRGGVHLAARSASTSPSVSTDASPRASRLLSDLRRDLHHTFRSVRRQPGMALACIAVLALGVGSSTAVFTVVNAVLLEPLPFREPQNLVRIWAANPERNLPRFSVSVQEYTEWKLQASSFERVGAFARQRDATLRSGDVPQAIEIARVSADLFRTLGVRPLFGRLLGDEDERPGGQAHVAVVSFGFWQTHLGGRADAIGQRIRIDSDSADAPRAPDDGYTVVGVMPQRFAVPLNPAQVWTPLVFSGAELESGARFLRVIARIAPGSSLSASRAQLETIGKRLAAQSPDTNNGWTVAVRDLIGTVVGDEFQQSLYVLGGMVALVLLIALANVTNLLLGRASERRRELAVRIALGAGRARLVRQLVAESLVLAAIAGSAGLLLTAWGVDLLRALQPPEVPRLDEIRIDGRVFAFAAALSLVAGVAVALIPAWLASRPQLSDSLKDSGGGSVGSVARHRMRSAFVVAELALAMVLLVAATLMVRSFIRIQSADLGFSAARVETVPIALPRSRYADSARTRQFMAAVLQRVSTIDGVETAAAASMAPFAGPNHGTIVTAEGAPPSRADESPDADIRAATPRFFDTLRIPVIRGRDFDSTDTPAALPVAIVNQRLAAQFWGAADPVGRRIRMGVDDSAPWLTVVGVVGDVRYYDLEASAMRPTLYLPFEQFTHPVMTIVVRARGDAAVAGDLRAVIAAEDPSLPLPVVTHYSEILDRVLSQRRFNSFLFVLLAAFALVLASVGLYALVAYAVAQRTREIGVRMALGAAPRDVMRLVVGEGLALAVAGVSLGMLGALAVARTLAGLLYHVSPTDPSTYAAIAIGLTAVAVLASYVPARRAMRVDPVTALRAD